MTMALAGDIIAAGQDNSCHILRFSLQEPEGPGTAGKDGETPIHQESLVPGAAVCFGDGLESPPAYPGCRAEGRRGFWR